MKTSRLLPLLLLAVATATAHADEQEKAAKADLAALQGEWTMVSAEVGGISLPETMRKNSRRVAKGDELTVTVGGQLLMKAKITLDPSPKPRTIDYQVTEGANAGKKQLGIYEINGDTVKFCFSAPGQDRPTAFTTKPGDGATASVWKRDLKPPN